MSRIISSSNVLGNRVAVRDFKNKNIVISVSGMKKGASLLLKCQGSFEDSAPDFSKVKSAENVWDYIAVKDLNDGRIIDGDTGILIEDYDDVQMYHIESCGLNWIAIEVVKKSSESIHISANIHAYSDN